MQLQQVLWIKFLFAMKLSGSCLVNGAFRVVLDVDKSLAKLVY